MSGRRKAAIIEVSAINPDEQIAADFTDKDAVPGEHGDETPWRDDLTVIGDVPTDKMDGLTPERAIVDDGTG